MAAQIQEHDGALRITVPPKRVQGVAIASFGALGVIGGVWACALGSEGIGAAIGVLVTVFALIVFWVGGVMSIFNRTIIDIDHGQLRVSEAPIRWPAVGFTLQLSAVRTVHEHRVGASERFSVWIKTPKHERMLPTGELGGEEAVELCARIREAVERAQKTG